MLVVIFSRHEFGVRSEAVPISMICASAIVIESYTTAEQGFADEGVKRVVCYACRTACPDEPHTHTHTDARARALAHTSSQTQTRTRTCVRRLPCTCKVTWHL